MYYDLAQTSLVKTPISLAEMYIPLWVYSSGNGAASAATGSGISFVQKGTTATVGNTTGSATKLHTLNSTWLSSQKFAFEVSIHEDTSGYTAYASLWDVSAGLIVSASQISILSTTATLIRSTQFTLIPGHIYAITIWTNGTGNTLLNKAHLIAFLS